jgi:hypothetical protein
MKYVGIDLHKRFLVAAVEDEWSCPALVDSGALGSLPHATFFLSYSIGDALSYDDGGFSAWLEGSARSAPGARFCPARRSLLVAQRFPVVSLGEIAAEDPEWSRN